MYDNILGGILQAFQLVDRGPFRRLIKYCRPSLTDADIPHRMTLRKEILSRAEIVKERVKDELKVCHFLKYEYFSLSLSLEYSRCRFVYI
jgi:hypothetical protein